MIKLPAYRASPCTRIADATRIALERQPRHKRQSAGRVTANRETHIAIDHATDEVIIFAIHNSIDIELQRFARTPGA